MILLIDHFDSFVHNQARYLARLQLEACVVRCDVITVEQVESLRPKAILLSPGPCTPSETGNSTAVIKAFWGIIPMLGICLGHQTLAAATGGSIVRASRPCHGRASPVVHDGLSEFRNVPQPFLAARYHSLVVEPRSLGNDWSVSARTNDDVVMGIRHNNGRVFGWQFHPESILTECGYSLLANFFRCVGLNVSESVNRRTEGVLPEGLTRQAASHREWQMPRSQGGRPLTF